MDYKKKYEEALENLKKIRNANENNKELADFIEYNYPELKESEDERIRKLLISIVEGWKKKAQDFRSFQILWTSNEEECDAILRWLKKKGEQKPMWSEEDEEILNTIIAEGDLKPSEIQWLKSLKERYTWKPSDEQTNALYHVVSKNLMDACRTKDDVLLEQLLNDLMKLKRE